MKKFHFFALSSLCLVAAPAFAQPTGSTKTTTVQAPAPVGPSLRAHLQLKAAQIEDLNALYDDWNAERAERDRFIAQRQEQLRRAQSPQNFDERAATQLSRDINEAQAQSSAHFLKVRASALRILTPLQRAQLEEVAKDKRLRIRDDQYSQLLLTSLGEAVTAPSTPTPNQRTDARYDDSRQTNNRQRDNRNQRNRRNSGGGSYGVYGGYGYGGPNYGVYGNYGQGNVGVGATIGRYGPSIGINVGQVFGGRWLR